MGGIGRSLEKCAREVPRCHHQSLMSNASQSSQEWNADRNVDNEAQAHEVSDGYENCIGNRARVMHVVFQQRIFCFICVLRLCEKLNLKMADYLIRERKCNSVHSQNIDVLANISQPTVRIKSKYKAKGCGKFCWCPELIKLGPRRIWLLKILAFKKPRTLHQYDKKDGLKVF